MTRFSSRTILAFVAPFTLLIALFASSTAKAAGNDDLNNSAIEEMIVVAHHTPTPAHLVGSSVSVLETEDFSQRITFDPAALLRILPSLSISQT